MHLPQDSHPAVSAQLMEILLFHRRGGISAMKAGEIQLAFVQYIHWQQAE